MDTVSAWTVRIDSSEHEGRTRAVAHLHTRDTERMVGVGFARLHPANVPGPRQPLYPLGRALVEISPYEPIASTLRVGVSIFSYRGRLTFGVTGDYDIMADVWLLARDIEAGMAQLVTAARTAPSPA